MAEAAPTAGKIGLSVTINVPIVKQAAACPTAFSGKRSRWPPRLGLARPHRQGGAYPGGSSVIVPAPHQNDWLPPAIIARSLGGSAVKGTNTRAGNEANGRNSEGQLIHIDLPGLSSERESRSSSGSGSHESDRQAANTTGRAAPTTPANPSQASARALYFRAAEWWATRSGMSHSGEGKHWY